MKYRMNKYERHAYLYSAWVAVIVPLITIVFYLNYNADFNSVYDLIKDLLSTALPITIIFGATGFFMREVFRQTSKQLFQFNLFKEDETKMPTTEMLIYKNHLLSKQRINQLSTKLKQDFDIELPSERDQVADEHEARLQIVDAVGLIRSATHGNILEQANYRYGFRRNLLGGLVWAMIAQILILILIIFCKFPIAPCIIGIILLICIFIVTWSSLKPAARNYARTLFNTYLQSI